MKRNTYHRLRTHCCAWGLWVALSAPGFAQTPGFAPPLSSATVSSASFRAAVRQAATNHPLTLSAARQRDAAAQDEAGARWQRFPAPSFESASPPGGQGLQRVNRLVLEQPLYAGGRIDASIDAAGHRLSASQHQQTQVTQETAIRLTNAWFDWQRLRKRVVVQQEGVQAHRQLRDQIERRAREGVSNDIELALASARLSQIQTELAQTQAALSATLEQLRQLAGDQLPALQAAGQALPPVHSPDADWIERATQRDPLLARLDAEQRAAEAEIRIKRAQLLPTVSLRTERNFSGKAGTSTWLQVNAQPGAGLSGMSGISAAQARQDATAEDRRNAERELRQALTADLASFDAAREQTGMASLLRQSTQDVAESYNRQFVAGRKSWLEVLNAVREAMQARLTVMDAEALLAQTAWRLHIRAFGLEALPGGSS